MAFATFFCIASIQRKVLVLQNFSLIFRWLRMIVPETVRSVQVVGRRKSWTVVNKYLLSGVSHTFTTSQQNTTVYRTTAESSITSWKYCICFCLIHSSLRLFYVNHKYNWNNAQEMPFFGKIGTYSENDYLNSGFVQKNVELVTLPP